MGRILGFLVLIDLALIIAAVADCLGGEHNPRRLNRPLWVLVILVVPIVGAIAWFTVGRHRARPSGTPRPRTSAAPDDDPEFLRDLERRLREDKDEQ